MTDLTTIDSADAATADAAVFSERVLALHARMTLEEKLAQLVGFWVDQGGEAVAPMQGEMAPSPAYEEATRHGLGQLTRVYGTRPVDPLERAKWLRDEQRRLKAETRRSRGAQRSTPGSSSGWRR
jgi:beta-xylosidase